MQNAHFTHNTAVSFRHAQIVQRAQDLEIARDRLKVEGPVVTFGFERVNMNSSPRSTLA